MSKKIKTVKESVFLESEYNKTLFKDESELLSTINNGFENQITGNDLNEANIKWFELAAIYEDHADLTRKKSLDLIAGTISSTLQVIPTVHSVRIRTKNPVSLLRKIIRKRKEGAKITFKNYRDLITDLIGVRVLHLLKDDWIPIHESIMSDWSPKEMNANIREGDDEKQNDIYKHYNVPITTNERKYRSVHYIIDAYSVKKEVFSVEIQVRTLYEEAWSELDHNLNYPYKAPPVVQDILNILNRFAGTADEMAMFAKYSHALHLQKDKELENKTREIENLQSEVGNMRNSIEKLDGKIKEKKELEITLKALEEKIKKLEKQNNPILTITPAISAGQSTSYFPNRVGALNEYITIPTSFDTGNIVRLNGTTAFTASALVGKSCVECGRSIDPLSFTGISGKCLVCQSRGQGGTSIYKL